tara:strand:+ start:2733 stop:3368 length:636 start_codon:yes stop_codon:yes gene_type:complete
MINFLTGNLGSIKSNLLKSFNRLPADPYEKSKGFHFRFRKYSKVVINIKSKEINFIKNTYFYQEKKTNRFAGGKKRVFKEIDRKNLIDFIDLFKVNFNKLFNQEARLEIGFHQLRIKCSKDFVGYPVPEGWHKDGFNYVAIINFQSSNISGGISRIKNGLNKDDAYSALLQKGDYILINDKKFFHYTDPINIDGNGKNGFRDTLVITIKNL